MYITGSAASFEVLDAIRGGDGGAEGASPGTTTATRAGTAGTGIYSTAEDATLVLRSPVSSGFSFGLGGGAGTLGTALHATGSRTTIDLVDTTLTGDTYLSGALAHLRGAGTITGGLTLSSGSTLAPGHSIGTLTVGTLDIAGTTLDAEIDANARTADLIEVTGATANITGATVNISTWAGTPRAGDVYRLLNVPAGVITGTFTLGTLPPGVSATLVHSPTFVDLRITAFVPPAPTAVPGLGGWSVAALALLLAACGLRPNRQPWRRP